MGTELGRTAAAAQVRWAGSDNVPPGYWSRHDQYPEPLTPLFAGLAIGSDIPRGLAAGRDEFTWPLPAPELIVVDGYLYAGTSTPTAPPSAARLAAFEAGVRGGRERAVVVDWHAERQAALHQTERRLLATNRPTLTDAALLGQIRACSLHAGDVFAAMLATAFANALTIGRLEAFAVRHLDLTEPDLARILAAISTRVSREPVERLEGLAREAMADETLRAALAMDDPRRSPAVRALLQPWLDAYGHHALALEYTAPTLAERPERVTRLLRDAVARLSSSREQPPSIPADGPQARIEGLRARLSGVAERRGFDRLLREVEAAHQARESARRMGDAAIGVQHLTLMEAGQRLAQRGLLAEAGQVFFLQPMEIVACLSGKLPSDLPARAESRRIERERQRTVTPPPSFGAPLPGPPLPLSSEGQEALAAVARYYGRVFTGPDTSLAPPSSLLRGAAGSPGTYRGVARVVVGEEHLDRVEPGTVLVCRITSPAWGALFGGIGALVTERGGILSHAATTAREFGIPAVVGVASATTTIRDGQMVDVDGTTGTVRIEPVVDLR